MSARPLHKNLILMLVALAQFMVVLDIAIVNVAIPSIFEALKFKSADDLQWVVTAYTLAFGGFLLLGGRAADLFGQRRVFLLGVSMFTAASLLCGLAATDAQIVIARAAQGLSAAIMSPAALAILIRNFKEGKERHRALGVWSAVAAGGAAAGVLLGGVLTQYLDWRWNFFVNVPVGVMLLAASLRFIPEGRAALKHRHLDLPGAVLVTSGLMMLVYGLSKAPSRGWLSESSLLFFSSSALLLVAFVVNETRSRYPLMPLSIFRIRNVFGANFSQLPVTASMFSMFFFLTLYVQTVLGYTPVKTGLSFLPITFIVGLTATTVTRFIARVGYKPFLMVGPVLLMGGFYLLSRLGADGGYWSDVFPGLAIVSVGMGMMFVAVTIAATNGVPHNEAGLASGLLNTSQQIGGSLGLAVLTGVAASKTSEVASKLGERGRETALQAQVEGYQEAFKIAIVFAVIALVLTALLIKQRKGEKIDPEAALIGG